MTKRPKGSTTDMVYFEVDQADIAVVIDVRDFGARGDGITDDTNSVEACIRYSREISSLREDLSMFIKAQLGISIAEPGETFVQTHLRLYRMSKRRAEEFGITGSENLDEDIANFAEYEKLQQWNAELAELLNEALDAGDRNVFGTDLWNRLTKTINVLKSGEII